MFEDKIKVAQLMTKTVTVGGLTNKFSQVLEFFTEFHIHHLPICENDILVGMISYSDMLKFIKAQLLNGKSVTMQDLDSAFSVSAVMTMSLISIAPNALIENAREILSEGAFQALPVVDEGKIVGIISNKDIVRLDATL